MENEQKTEDRRGVPAVDTSLARYVNIVTGPNESGKSRLLQHLNAVTPRSRIVRCASEWSRDTFALEYSRTRRSSQDESILSALQTVDPAFLSLDILDSPAGGFNLYALHRHGGRQIVLSFGDGVQRALRIAFAAIEVGCGMLLLDDYGSCFDQVSLARFTAWLVAAAPQAGHQLWVTTHSLEVIDTVLAAVPGNEDLAFFRLPPAGSGDDSLALDGRKLRYLRCELGQDVR